MILVYQDKSKTIQEKEWKMQRIDKYTLEKEWAHKPWKL